MLHTPSSPMQRHERGRASGRGYRSPSKQNHRRAYRVSGNVNEKVSVVARVRPMEARDTKQNERCAVSCRGREVQVHVDAQESNRAACFKATMAFDQYVLHFATPSSAHQRPTERPTGYMTDLQSNTRFLMPVVSSDSSPLHSTDTPLRSLPTDRPAQGKPSRSWATSPASGSLAFPTSVHRTRRVCSREAVAFSSRRQRNFVQVARS